MNAPIISTLHILLLIIKSLFACRRFRSLLIMVVYKKYVRSLSLSILIFRAVGAPTILIGSCVFLLLGRRVSLIHTRES